MNPPTNPIDILGQAIADLPNEPEEKDMTKVRHCAEMAGLCPKADLRTDEEILSLCAELGLTGELSQENKEVVEYAALGIELAHNLMQIDGDAVPDWYVAGYMTSMIAHEPVSREQREAFNGCYRSEMRFLIQCRADGADIGKDT